MPLWRCPHCATPQQESARCWLCGRSTTTCAACRHYRRGIAGGLGLCGLNPRKLALRGTEVLPCWEAVAAADDTTAIHDLVGIVPRGRDEAGPGHASRTFVPVDELRAAKDGSVPAPAPVPVGGTVGNGRWSLWGDPEA